MYWTVYHYDGIGRTTSVVAPDNSTTTYQYGANTVTVTDPAGKYKTFFTNAMGNLTQVQESDPTLGLVATSYTYDILNHLTGVSMPRGANTQTRTFTYNVGTTVGIDLLSAKEKAGDTAQKKLTDALDGVKGWKGWTGSVTIRYQPLPGPPLCASM